MAVSRSPEENSYEREECLLSEAMISYWTRFAKTGNPNSKDQPHWPRYLSAVDERLSFVPPVPTVESGVDFDSFHKCSSYWAGL